jgi:hypothetical protein
MRGEIGKIVAVGVQRILAGAALGRQHVEEQLDQRFVGCRRPAAHRLFAVRPLAVLEEFVGRNRHHDLARMVLHEIGEREHRDIAQPADEPDEDQKSEQARHGRNPAAPAPNGRNLRAAAP